MPRAPTLRRNIGTLLCTALSAYRLLDVMYAIQHPEGLQVNPSYPRCRTKGLRPPSSVWPLANWVSLLHKARASITALDALRSSPSQAVLQSKSSAADVQLRLFKEFHTLWKQQSGSNILMNVQLAALHLRFMLNGNIGKELNIIPDLPDTPDALVAVSRLTGETANFWKDFIQKVEPGKLRHPLYGALLFSPLYLLVDIKLTHNAWNQGNMVLYSKALGNQKPDLIKAIEQSLWQVLLDIATGRKLTLPAMHEFLTNLPWDDLEMVDRPIVDFFTEDSSLPALKDSILSVVGEISLHPSWPLSKLRGAEPSSSNDGVQDPAVPATQQEPQGQVEQPSDMQQDPVRLSDSDMRQEPQGQVEQPPADSDMPLAPASAPVPTFDSDMPQDPTEPPPSSSDTDKPKRRKTKKPKKRPAVSKKAKRPQSSSQTVFIPYQEIQDGVFLQPVRVPTFQVTPTTFDAVGERWRIQGREVEIVEITGSKRTWIPEFHHQDDQDGFRTFYERAVACYKDGLPLYLSDPNNSAIQIVPFAQYQLMSVQAVQRLMAQRHIIVTDFPTKRLNFDEDGMDLLNGLDSPIDIQDQSVRPEDDINEQLVIGTMEQILEATRVRHGPIVNALSNPLPFSAVEKSPISSEIEAWFLTGGNGAQKYPTALMRWALCSTAGARHWMHIDADGLGTYFDIACGGKWLFLSELPTERGCPHFNSIQDFLVDFKTDAASNKFHVEAVYLTPGTRLIMRPNTPHAVFTVEHTIAFGGHFYSFSNMQETISGIIHQCAIDYVITNTDHPDVRILLFRMLQYVYKFYTQSSDRQRLRGHHLPILNRSEDFFNILSLCNYCILANVLDSRTYSFPKESPSDPKICMQRRFQYDYNALDPPDRFQFMYFRGLALNLITWMSCNYRVVEVGDAERLLGVKMVAGHFLAHQAAAILNYKARAVQAEYKGLPNCDTSDIKRQLELLFAKGILGQKPSMFSEESVEEDPITLGTTKGDELFRQGSKLQFPISLASEAEYDFSSSSSNSTDEGD